MICKPHKLTVSPHRNTENTRLNWDILLCYEKYELILNLRVATCLKKVAMGATTRTSSALKKTSTIRLIISSVPKNLWCVGEALIAAFISGKTSSVLRSMPVLESLNSEGLRVSHNAWSLNWPVCRAFMNWEHFEHHETNNRTKKAEDR